MARHVTTSYPFYEGSLTIVTLNREFKICQQYYNHNHNHNQPYDDVGLKAPMSYYRQLI